MQARPVEQDAEKKPKAQVEASQCHPLTFSYESSPSGVDSNLLILLHGLGDTKEPFASLGKKLAGNLPQTAVLSLQGGSPIPLLLDPGWGWWKVWDDIGQEVPSPDPSPFLTAFTQLLNYLIKPTAEGGCGWPASSIHLFGFAQGGAAAMEGAIAWTRAQRSGAKIQEEGREAAGETTAELGSVVNVCGALLSHPTFSPPLRVPLLHFHRQSGTATASSCSASIRKAFANVQDACFRSSQPEAMPQKQAEWTAIMAFWSKVVRNRSRWELEGPLYTMGSGGPPGQ